MRTKKVIFSVLTIIFGSLGLMNIVSTVSAKYSCGFSNLLDSSIIVNER